MSVLVIDPASAPAAPAPRPGSECMRLVSAFVRTAEDRTPVGSPSTADGCKDPAQVFVATPQEPQFAHIESPFERDVARRHLGDITCCVQVAHRGTVPFSVSSASGLALHDDGAGGAAATPDADGHVAAVDDAPPPEWLRDGIMNVSGVASAGNLFCYVAKLANGTRWCRVFRCEDAAAVRTAAEAAVKDALLTARYNAKMASVSKDAIETQHAFMRQVEDRARLQEAETMEGDIDKLMKRMEAPFIFAVCPLYHKPPAYRHNPDDLYGGEDDGSSSTLVPSEYARVPAFDDTGDGDDDEAADATRVAEAHQLNCKRAWEHHEGVAKAARRRNIEKFRTDPNKPEVRRLFEPESITAVSAEERVAEANAALPAEPTAAGSRGGERGAVASDGGALHVDDPAVELAMLRQQSGVTQTVAGFHGAVELECGCGFGHVCETHRRKLEDEEVFEGFGAADDGFDGFGATGDDAAEYVPEMYYLDEADDEGLDLMGAAFRCRCGVPYEAFCRTCDFKARKALADTPAAPAAGESPTVTGSRGSVDETVFAESSFLDDQGVDALRAAADDSGEPLPAYGDVVSAAGVSPPGAAVLMRLGDNRPAGLVGYLDEEQSVGLLRYTQTGNYVIRQLDDASFVVMIKAPSADKPVVRVPVRKTEDGRFDCGSRLFYRLPDVVEALRKNPIKTGKANKDWGAELWLNAPVRTDLYVHSPPPKGSRKSIARRLSSWMWR